MTNTKLLVSGAALTLLSVPLLASARDFGTAKPKAECTALAHYAVGAKQIRLATRGAHIVDAKIIAAEGEPGSANYLPEYCSVTGEIASVDASAPPIRFGLALPMQWNRKAIQIGGNGMNGFIPWLAALDRDGPGSPYGPAFPPNSPYPLAQGYATYGDDSGHVSGQGHPPGGPGGVAPKSSGSPPEDSNDWMANAESWRNFSYEAIRKGHDAAMAVISHFYGEHPRINYFMGESHGGRQALNAIARYGDDYNGVLVSVPLSYFTGILVSITVRFQESMQPGGSLPPAKFPALAREVIRQCDEMDGLKDGVINNYLDCAAQFDPRLHPDALTAVRCADGSDSGMDCLSDAQIKAVNAFHSPLVFGYPLANGERDWPGAPVGEEFVDSWLANPGAGGGIAAMMSALLHDPSVSATNFNIAKDQKAIQQLSEALDAPMDWRPFFAKGGKVVFHTATDDYLTNAHQQWRVYESVVKLSGQAQFDAHARFYATPGGDHGSHSFSYPDKRPQPHYSDLVGVLERWVEDGQTPPEAVQETEMQTSAPYQVLAARPLCRFPNYPHYNGGDPKAMQSYSCAAPQNASYRP
jgi:feruloyl esterase